MVARMLTQRPREQTEAVDDRAPLVEVGRVGEADDQARQETRARVVRVHDPTETSRSGVPVGDTDVGLEKSFSTSTSSDSSPRALSRCRRTSASLPGHGHATEDPGGEPAPRLQERVEVGCAVRLAATATATVRSPSRPAPLRPRDG